MSFIESHDSLHGMLDFILKAKKEGLMDHRESRELLNQCLKAVGAPEMKSGPGVRQG